jgi:multiple antibiotic resistance protein
MVLALKDVWDAFIMLFIVLDSIGNIPIFYSLTSGMKASERNKVFLKSVLVASALLVFFTLFGYTFFAYYNVSVADFKIAGGIILFIIGIEGIFGKIEAEMLRSEDLAIVPMATPLLAGPGSIYMVMYLNNTFGLVPTLLSILLNTIAGYIILANSSILLGKAGKNTVLVVSRIFSLFLAVLAVSFIRSGIEEALRSMGA